MADHGYEEVANALRALILSGEVAPGETLPSLTEIMKTYQVSTTTARKAISVLTSEGLVTPVRRRGTVVRDRSALRHVTRTRRVFRDEIGYYFDPAAQDWRALRPPTIDWASCPWDIASALQIAVGDEVLVRDRLIGDPATKTPMQLATSYLPATLARGTQLAEADTGHGGIYARFEEMGFAPLRWYERISAQMPTPSEVDALGLPTGVPLLRIIRTTTSDSGRVLEVNDTRMSSERFEVGYPIERDPSAQ